VLWAWAAGILAANIILLLLPVQLETVYRHREQEDFLEITFGLAGWWGQRSVIMPPLREWWPQPDSLPLESIMSTARQAADRDGGRPESKGRNRLARFIIGRAGYWWDRLKSLIAIWRQFFAGVTCQRFRLFLAPGASDPAAAALFYGGTWSVLAWMYRNLRQHSRLNFKVPPWQVVPRFDSPDWQIDLNCIFTFRLGHIISAAGQSLWLSLPIVRQAKGAGLVARTSHRGLDEDRHGKHQGYG